VSKGLLPKNKAYGVSPTPRVRRLCGFLVWVNGGGALLGAAGGFQLCGWCPRWCARRCCWVKPCARFQDPAAVSSMAPAWRALHGSEKRPAAVCGGVETP